MRKQLLHHVLFPRSTIPKHPKPTNLAASKVGGFATARERNRADVVSGEDLVRS
jgi:hypothetical protein